MLFAPAQVTFDCNFLLHFPRHRQDNHDRRGSHETGGKICNGNYRIKVVVKVKSDSNYSCCESEANQSSCLGEASPFHFRKRVGCGERSEPHRSRKPRLMRFLSETRGHRILRDLRRSTLARTPEKLESGFPKFRLAESALPAHSWIAVRYRAKPLIHNKNHDNQPRILKAR